MAVINVFTVFLSCFTILAVGQHLRDFKGRDLLLGLFGSGSTSTSSSASTSVAVSGSASVSTGQLNFLNTQISPSSSQSFSLSNGVGFTATGASIVNGNPSTSVSLTKSALLGLGLTADPSGLFGITNGNLLRFNITVLKRNCTKLQFTFSSNSPSPTVQIYGSNSNATLGILLYSSGIGSTTIIGTLTSTLTSIMNIVGGILFGSYIYLGQPISVINFTAYNQINIVSGGSTSILSMANIIATFST